VGVRAPVGTVVSVTVPVGADDGTAVLTDEVAVDGLVVVTVTTEVSVEVPVAAACRCQSADSDYHGQGCDRRQRPSRIHEQQIPNPQARYAKKSMRAGLEPLSPSSRVPGTGRG